MSTNEIDINAVNRKVTTKHSIKYDALSDGYDRLKRSYVKLEKSYDNLERNYKTLLRFDVELVVDKVLIELMKR